ncbi:MAG: 5-oxoprolinase subunit PxpA [Acetobacter sp.]|uniref:LamB/YcsF family protein n=1 Tax=Acetobacter sp. TaxID=440 RepID=UPI0039E7FF52
MTPSHQHEVDLNADLGEGFGCYRIGDDDAMLSIVTSANVACGFHAGDPEIMAATFSKARELGVRIGAHPGFPDLWGFGRRVMPFTPPEIERLVAYQVGAAMGMAAYSGETLRYVKPHGSLGNLTESNTEIAEAVARAIYAVDPRLPVLAIAGGQLDLCARTRNMTVFSEIFADRGYTEEGRLVSRKLPGALIHDPDYAADRVVRMVRAGAVETLSGAMVPAKIDSICVHGDNAHSVEVARRVREALLAAGIAVRAFC